VSNYVEGTITFERITRTIPSPRPLCPRAPRAPRAFPERGRIVSPLIRRWTYTPCHFSNEYTQSVRFTEGARDKFGLRNGICNLLLLKEFGHFLSLSLVLFLFLSLSLSLCLFRPIFFHGFNVLYSASCNRYRVNRDSRTLISPSSPSSMR